MAKGGVTFHFKINGYTPQTLPMARLASYMTDLATLLGHIESVHFVKVAPGSADLVHKVSEPERPEVKKRLHLVKNGLGPADAQGAYRNLNAKLAEDGKTATMTEGRGKLLNFPGQAAIPVEYGPIPMQGHLDGRVIRVGGKDNTKPVHIMNADAYYICNANADVARRLAPYYEREVRVFGTGRWYRRDNGNWELDGFNIADFEELNEDPLDVVVAGLRAIPGNGWQDVEDPLAELAALRGRGVPN